MIWGMIKRKGRDVADLDEGGPQRRRGVAHGEAVTGRVGICLLGLEGGGVTRHLGR